MWLAGISDSKKGNNKFPVLDDLIKKRAEAKTTEYWSRLEIW